MIVHLQTLQDLPNLVCEGEFRALQAMDAKFSTSPEHSHSQTDDERDSIAQLQDAVPQLESLFIISQCIGHGTFSSVYLARTKHTTTINGRRHFAIKHIIPTSHPSRVFMELKCLKMIGGADNVMGVTMCFREMNHIILIMPHFPHDSFAEYVGCLSICELQDYLMNLLIALKRVHSFKIIHRDVKPANFLYNRKHRRYSLIDFGLAQEVGQTRSFNLRNIGKITSLKELSKSTSSPILDTPHLTTNKTVKRKLGVCDGELVMSEKAKRPRQLSSPHVVPGILSCTSNHVNTSLRRSPRKHCTIPVSPKKENFESLSKVEQRKTPKKAHHNSVFHEDSPSKNTRSAETCHKTGNFGNNNGKDGVISINQIKHEVMPTLRRSPRKLNSINQSIVTPLEGLARHLQDVTMLQASSNSPVLKLGRNKTNLSANCDSTFTSHSVNHRHRQSRGAVNCSPAVCGNAITPDQNGISSKLTKNGRVLQEVQTRSGCVLRPVSCHCYGSARVCGVCAARSNQVAPRAGTPGFRAPEVLLRHPDQGTAVDMWSVGVILLCLLSGRYPFFRAADDLSTVAEISTLLGTKTVRKAAANLGKLLTCSEDRNPLDLMKVCEILRNNNLNDSDSHGRGEPCVGCCQKVTCVCLSIPARSFSPSQGLGYQNKKRAHVQETHHQKKGIVPSVTTCPSPLKKRTKSQISLKSPSKKKKNFSEQDLFSVNKTNSISIDSQRIRNKTGIQTGDRASPCSEKKIVGASSFGVYHQIFTTNFNESPAEGIASTCNTPSEYPLLVYHLLLRLLDPNPETRITAEEALAHPFLSC